MSLLSRIFQKSNSEKKGSVSLIGPSNAGKTTFIKFMETGKEVEDNIGSTLGIEVRKHPIEIDGWKLSAIDTGGQELYQQTFWELAVSESIAVIFVIDSVIRPEDNKEEFDQMIKQFAYSLDIIPEAIPILIVLNKQDLVEQNPMQPDEIDSVFEVKKLRGRKISILPCSAKYGDGVFDALSWLIEQI